MDRNKLRDLQLTQLKKAAKVFLRSQDALPFSVVVEAMTEKEVLPVTTDGRDHKMLLALADSCVQTVASSRCGRRFNRPILLYNRFSLFTCH